MKRSSKFIVATVIIGTSSACEDECSDGYRNTGLNTGNPDDIACEVNVQSFAVADATLEIGLEITDFDCDRGQAGSVSIPLVGEDRGVVVDGGTAALARVRDGGSFGEFTIGLLLMDLDSAPIVEVGQVNARSIGDTSSRIRGTLDEVTSACSVPLFDGGRFTAIIFATDAGDVTVPAGRASRVTIDGASFIAGAPWAYAGPPGRDPLYEGLFTLWRTDE